MPPFDLGFVSTRWLNRLLAARPALNTVLAGLNTVFVAMQSSYIVWTFMVEGRLRPGLAALFMFTCRGILCYSTHRSCLPQRPPNFFIYQTTSAGLDGRNCCVHEHYLQPFISIDQTHILIGVSINATQRHTDKDVCYEVLHNVTVAVLLEELLNHL